MANIYDIPVNKITGEKSTLGEFRGKVLLIVNTASKCGLTPQYEGLEKLYEKYKGEGLEILGFPANDFAGQEPGTNEEIAAFCTGSFGVKFPMYEKIAVTGAETHPLYKELIAEKPEVATNEPGGFRKKLAGYGITANPEPGILWNFEKFVVGRDGKVSARISPEVPPEDALVTGSVESALKA